MSLPDFSSQMDLFGLQRQLVFEESDRYRLFFEKIYPVLAKARERLAACYCLENGRPGVEPVVLLGVSMLQFMERMPDRQAVEQFRYHVGWKYAGHVKFLGVKFSERTIKNLSGQSLLRATI